MSFPGQTVGASLFTQPLSITYGDEAHLVEYAALAQIKSNLEQECERIETVWSQRDQDLMAALDLQFIPCVIERVQPQNFFVGARPSLIQSSSDFWPSVTTRAALSRASKEQIDLVDVYDVQLDVEVLCKWGPIPQERLHERDGVVAEGEVNKQVQRLSAAVHNCLRLDPTLGRTVEPLAAPTKRLGFPFALAGVNRERTGDYWVYCGRQMRYQSVVNAF